MRHPFLCRPMTSTVKRRIKEHALIVRESMLPLVNQTALLWSGLLCSLFVHLRHPETARSGKTSAAPETFQRSASKEAPWQSNATCYTVSKRRT